MLCKILPLNREIFSATASELSDWTHYYEVRPLDPSILVYDTSNKELDEFFENRHLNREKVLITEL